MQCLSDDGAERGVLAGAIKHREVYEDIENLITEESFTDEIRQILWKLIKYIRRDDEIKIDFLLLRSTARELKLDKIFELKDNLDYARAIFNLEIEASTARKLAKKVFMLTFRRYILGKSSQLKNEIVGLSGSETLNEVRAVPEKILYQISDYIDGSEERKVIHIGDGLEEYFKYLCDNPKTLAGISTGYPIYDSYIGGLLRKTVSIVGARTGVGKSMLCDNIADHICRNLQIPGLMCDSEMDIEGHWSRVMAMISGVPITEIMLGKFAQNDYKLRLVKKAKDYLINNSKYKYVNISGAPFEETIGIARRWVRKEIGINSNGRTNDCVIFYDYLKLMTGDGISNDIKEYQIMGFQTTQLHNFAVKYDLPIFATIQLNRDGITKNGLEALSQSDRIGWLASNVSLYKPKDDSEDMSEGNMKLIVVKSRHGMTHRENQFINMKFNILTGKIIEGNLSSTQKRTGDESQSNSGPTSNGQRDNSGRSS